MSLSRLQTHTLSSEICADCSAPDAGWASLNRGVLICAECCSIHRSIGRHISQVKSIRKGSWHPNELAMVYTLYSHGSNNVWEHTLHDPTVNQPGRIRRKPNARDALYPTKSDFIRAKYVNQSFLLRPELPSANHVDLDAQLHSCARTTHIETSLRLLSLGADPNWVDPQTEMTTLQVAAREGQSLQVELLVLYGADASTPDSLGRTAADIAAEEGCSDLANRLTQLQHQVTDMLSFYLCGRTPEHSDGIHFLIPEMADVPLQPARTARQKLFLIQNSVLEKLAIDVYDEIDRRQTDATWIATQSSSKVLVNERYIVPFLPVNPAFSTARNQGRQKLAKLSAKELASLVVDLLVEAKRRILFAHPGADRQYKSIVSKAAGGTNRRGRPSQQSQGEASGPNEHSDRLSSDRLHSGMSASSSDVSGGELHNSRSSTPQSGPVYDEVPTESEGAAGPTAVVSDPGSSRLPSSDRSIAKISSPLLSIFEKQKLANGESSAASDKGRGDERSRTAAGLSKDDYWEMKRQISVTDGRIEHLECSYSLMLEQLNRISGQLQKIFEQGDKIRQPIAAKPSPNDARSSEPNDRSNFSAGDLRSSAVIDPAVSRRPAVDSGHYQQAPFRGAGASALSLPNGQSSSFSTTGGSLAAPAPFPPPRGNYANVSIRTAALSDTDPKPSTSVILNLRQRSSSSGAISVDGGGVGGVPGKKDCKTTVAFPAETIEGIESLTQAIQNLHRAAVSCSVGQFAGHASHIQAIVDRLASLVPRETTGNSLPVHSCLDSMVDASIRLTIECAKLRADMNLEQYTTHVINVAYEVAKAAKMLMHIIQ